MERLGSTQSSGQFLSYYMYIYRPHSPQDEIYFVFKKNPIVIWEFYIVNLFCKPTQLFTTTLSQKAFFIQNIGEITPSNAFSNWNFNLILKNAPFTLWRAHRNGLNSLFETEHCGSWISIYWNCFVRLQLLFYSLLYDKDYCFILSLLPNRAILFTSCNIQHPFVNYCAWDKSLF